MSDHKVANGIAGLALVVSLGAGYFAWDANRIAKDSYYVGAAVKVTFTDTRHKKDNTIKLVVYNTSTTLMRDPQVEMTRPAPMKVVIARLKDLPPCTKSVYLIDGKEWKTKNSALVFDDGSGHVWRKAGRMAVERLRSNAVNRNLPEHARTYSMNEIGQLRGMRVILPQREPQTESKNCG